ncbi:hypothetical protein SEA_SAPO_56 [Gordonia phage Sapo]|nr:hypothetical protein SEA_SAPO_56 [Gordonia phage Sapo]
MSRVKVVKKGRGPCASHDFPAFETRTGDVVECETCGYRWVARVRNGKTTWWRKKTLREAFQESLGGLP